MVSLSQASPHIGEAHPKLDGWAIVERVQYKGGLQWSEEGRTADLISPDVIFW
jgi:hypothetical protein